MSGPVFDIRHGERVRCLTEMRYADGGLMLRKDAVGTVRAMITKQGKAEYLVKWKGRAWPVAVFREHLEKVT